MVSHVGGRRRGLIHAEGGADNHPDTATLARQQSNAPELHAGCHSCSFYLDLPWSIHGPLILSKVTLTPVPLPSRSRLTEGHGDLLPPSLYISPRLPVGPPMQSRSRQHSVLGTWLLQHFCSGHRAPFTSPQVHTQPRPPDFLQVPLLLAPRFPYHCSVNLQPSLKSCPWLQATDGGRKATLLTASFPALSCVPSLVSPTWLCL